MLTFLLCSTFLIHLAIHILFQFNYDIKPYENWNNNQEGISLLHKAQPV